MFERRSTKSFIFWPTQRNSNISKYILLTCTICPTHWIEIAYIFNRSVSYRFWWVDYGLNFFQLAYCGLFKHFESITLEVEAKAMEEAIAFAWDMGSRMLYLRVTPRWLLMPWWAIKFLPFKLLITFQALCLRFTSFALFSFYMFHAWGIKYLMI